MSVLLRQAHGFEGLRLARVELPVDDQTVPERVDVRTSQRDFDPRGAPPHPLVDQRHYAVPGIDQFDSDWKGLARGQQLSQYCLAPSIPRSNPSVVQHRQTRRHPMIDFRVAGAPDELARSPARKASGPRTSSTFSCDIAYSERPTASRALGVACEIAEAKDPAVSKRDHCAISARRFNPVIRPVPMARPARGPNRQVADVVMSSLQLEVDFEALPGHAGFRRARELLQERGPPHLGVEVLDPRVEVVAIPRVEEQLARPPRSPATSPAQYPQAQESA